MFESIKNKAAAFIVNRELKKKKHHARSFNDMFKNSFSFLILMPEDEKDFHQSVEFLKGMDTAGKKFSLLIKDYRVSLLPQKYHSAAIGYGIQDTTRLLLPAKALRDKLISMKFDLVIDLNREENLFCSYVTNLVNAEFKAGARKRNSDRYYNLQISGSKYNSDIFYKNFLNCLQMF